MQYVSVIDEFRMVLGGQPTPWFFFFNYRIREKQVLPCRSSIGIDTICFLF